MLTHLRDPNNIGGFLIDPIDTSSVRAGRNKTVPSRPVQPIDSSGTYGWIFYFKTQDLGVQCGDTSISLTGVTANGNYSFYGEDTLITMNCATKPPQVCKNFSGWWNIMNFDPFNHPWIWEDGFILSPTSGQVEVNLVPLLYVTEDVLITQKGCDISFTSDGLGGPYNYTLNPLDSTYKGTVTGNAATLTGGVFAYINQQDPGYPGATLTDNHATLTLTPSDQTLNTFTIAIDGSVTVHLGDQSQTNTVHKGPGCSGSWIDLGVGGSRVCAPAL